MQHQGYPQHMPPMYHQQQQQQHGQQHMPPFHAGGPPTGHFMSSMSIGTDGARERTGETSDVQVIEKIVEVPQRIQQEKIVHVARQETVERRVPVPKPVYKEKIVEVPQIQYREVPLEKIIEVPELQTQFLTREVDVPFHVDVPIIQPRKTPVEQEIQRNIPMPIEVRVAQSYEIPKLKPKYKEVPVPIYVPRYIEVPVPAQFVNSFQGGPPQNQLTSGATASRLVSQASVMQQPQLQMQPSSPNLQTSASMSPGCAPGYQPLNSARSCITPAPGSRLVSVIGQTAS